MNDLLLEKFLKIEIGPEGAIKPFWNRTTCHRCSEEKKTKAKDMSFNMSTGAYICHKCAWKGNVLYQKREDYVRPVMQEYKPSDKVKEYFLSRGIQESTYDRLVERKLIAPTPKGDGFSFYYFRDDEYINYKARSLAEKKFYQQADGEKILFNINSAKGKTKAIIVEGEMSVLACIEAGLEDDFALLSLENGASKEGSVEGKLAGLRNCYEQLAGIDTWIVALDDDQAGVYTGDALIKYLGAHKCRIVQFPRDCKDPDDIINRNKRGEFTSKQNNDILKDVMLNSIEFPVKGIIQLNDKLKELLMQYKKYGRPPAVKIPRFEGTFSFKRGDLTVISGFANVGKSLFAMNLLYLMLMEYQWKWVVFAGEQHPQDRYFEDLASMILQKPIEDKDRNGHPVHGCATPEEYEAALEFISNHIFLVYPERGQKPTLEWIMEKVNFLKQKHGINGVILDTFNKMKHDFKNNRDDVYLDDWLDLCIEYASDFDAFLLLMHPSKPSRTKSGAIPIMGMYDIAGGAMTPNKVDNIIIYHREYTLDESGMASSVATVKFEKIRDQKTVGRPSKYPIDYDPFKNAFKYGEVGYTYTKTLDTATREIISSSPNEDYLDEIPF